MPVIGAFDFAPIAGPGRGFDGVVSIALSADGGHHCTGSLLRSGRDVLSAAHCFDDDGDRVADRPRYFVTFELAGGREVTLPVGRNRVMIHPGWNGSYQDGADLAILRLPRAAPRRADRYDIDRGGEEVGRLFTIVGYGNTGVGAAGELPGVVARRLGRNEWDLVLPAVVGSFLQSDFDDGTTDANRSGGLGLGAAEAITGGGDSGGPAFLDGFRIAGVTSYGGTQFGRNDYHTRVSAFREFIDAAMDAPFAPRPIRARVGRRG